MQQSSKSNMYRRTKFPFSFLSSSPLILLLGLIFVIRMAESVPSMADSSAAASIQIVYTKRPQDKEPEAYHIRTLASVLGSEDAAKEALLYNYNTVASGFSAKLTPQQAEQISKLLGVLQVVPNMKVQLHTGPRIGRLH
uniref:Inhibitor I9 domain-containing protein n=1 Tax=Salix viminalis TaxID=40686 RepID=A0A6N2LJ74_SALVM